MQRRDFVALLGLLPLVGKTVFADNSQKKVLLEQSKNDGFEETRSKEHSISDLIIPPRLKEGDTVAFTSPASPTSMGSIQRCVSFFKSKGCKIVVGDTIKKQKNKHSYFSETDEVRATELNQFFADESIRAIICGRGGYGVMRILPMLDYKSLASNPKIIMGYSDITALHLAVYRQCCISGFSGPVASSKWDNDNKRIAEMLLFQYDKPVIYNAPEMKVINPQFAKNAKLSGQLQGGTLTLISETLGTDYEIDMNDSLLFFEDKDVHSYQIDRMLTHLVIANKFKSCSGVLVGKMKKFDYRGNFHPNRAYSKHEVLEQFSEKTKLPVIYDLPFGHENSSLIFPHGVTAEVDIKKKTIELKM